MRIWESAAHAEKRSTLPDFAGGGSVPGGIDNCLATSLAPEKREERIQMKEEERENNLEERREMREETIDKIQESWRENREEDSDRIGTKYERRERREDSGERAF